MLSQKMSISERILRILSEPKFRYKGVSVNIFGLPVFSSYKRQSIYNSLGNLRREGYIEKQNDFIKMLPRGRKYVENKKRRMIVFDSPFKKDAPKNLLVMFDIPEGQKAEREWFRYHLRRFGFIMIQRSVWVGSSPLPKEFMNYLKFLHLGKCIKTFKLAKSYTQS